MEAAVAVWTKERRGRVKSVDACAHVLPGCQTAGKAHRCTDWALADTPGQCRYHCVGMCCLDGEVHRTAASGT